MNNMIGITSANKPNPGELSIEKRTRPPLLPNNHVFESTTTSIVINTKDKTTKDKGLGMVPNDKTKPIKVTRLQIKKNKRLKLQ